MKKGIPEDNETLEYFEKVKNKNELTWSEKLQLIVEFKKKRGLTGIHFSVYPTSGYPISGDECNQEKLAKGVFDLMYASAKGKYEEYEEGDVL